MHTVSELETNVPAFLGKLWKLVEDPEHDDLICWAPVSTPSELFTPTLFERVRSTRRDISRESMSLLDVDPSLWARELSSGLTISLTRTRHSLPENVSKRFR